MKESPEHIEIAKSLMKEIMFDNGMVDRWHPEKYPERWVNKIAKSAGVFFDAHPELLTNEDIENICCGEMEENEQKYGSLPEYEQLNKDLNNYFDH